MTDWTSYYQSLENWVQEKYQVMSEVQKYFQNSLKEQERFTTANILAFRKYEFEMRLFQSSSNNESPIQNNTAQNLRHFHRYLIPHPWRRIVAACVDSMIMLFLNLILIYFIKRDSTFIEVTKHVGFNFLFGAEYRTTKRAYTWVKSELIKKEFSMFKLEKLSYIFEIWSDDNSIDLDLLISAHQIGKLLEVILISYSFFGTTPGGATFGKWLMNLKVVSYDEIIEFSDRVEVFPGSNLGIFRALVRSFFKGTSIFTFMSCSCMIVLNYHRCIHDIIAGSLVVQSLQDNNANERQQRQERG